LTSIFGATVLPAELADLDGLDAIGREQLELRISTDARRYGKLMTLVNGIDDPSLDAKKLMSTLKSKCACGVALKEGHIELQGDHSRRVFHILAEMGFQARIG
jgi:translation initiation factor 1